MPYYTLISRKKLPGATGEWSPQFGDHDRETVEYERGEHKRTDAITKIRYDYKIITTPTAHKRTVDAAIAKLNAGK